jgi:hypothetical protein
MIRVADDKNNVWREIVKDLGEKGAYERLASPYS